MTDALATRILFQGDRAIGVELLRNNELETVRAEREVIVSAGTYHSPQVLLLSGVGPADALREMGIEPRADLPVGRNLHDHPISGLGWVTNAQGLLAGITPENSNLFEKQGRGPLTSNVAEGGAFVRTRPELAAPDIQLHFAPTVFTGDHLAPPVMDSGYGIGSTLLKPSSRGSVMLRGPLPHVKPRITHNYLTTEEDRRSTIDGIRVALEIASRPALRKLRGSGYALPASDSNADILAFVRRRTSTCFHPVGTCAMGSVVDAELRVLGLEGLRVVDASVMPTIPRGNTNAPTIMVAEKAADLIRDAPPLSLATTDAFAVSTASPHA